MYADRPPPYEHEGPKRSDLARPAAFEPATRCIQQRLSSLAVGGRRAASACVGSLKFTCLR
jgi:hypothetical protein